VSGHASITSPYASITQTSYLITSSYKTMETIPSLIAMVLFIHNSDIPLFT